MTTSITRTVVWNRVGAIRIANENLDVLVLPERGAEIHQIRHRDLDYFWVNEPDVRRLESESGRAIEEFFLCGFYTMFPNAGKEGEYAGVRYDGHGDLRLVAWTARESADGQSIQLAGQSRRAPVRIDRTLRLEDRSVVVRDTLSNQGTTTFPYVYGLHPYHSSPLLDENVILKVDNKVVATLPKRSETLTRLTSVDSGSAGVAEVVNEKLGRGVRYRYDPAFMNNTWIWLNLDSSSSLFPYVASLLPCTTSTPTAEGIELAVAKGTARWLEPGQSVSTQWSIEVW